MQKIFNTQQIKRCDEFTINHEPILGIDLMERAATALFDSLMEICSEAAFEVYCGQGNNGGDGLALSRLLLQSGKKVKTFVIAEKDKGSNDFETNLKRLLSIKEAQIIYLKQENNFINPEDNSVIIDALLGTGLKHSAQGVYKEAIKHINSFNNFTLAVDCPSGLMCDIPIETDATVVCANITFSFQFVKTSFLLPEYSRYTGKVKVLDIGLHRDFIEQEPCNLFYTDKLLLTDILPERSKFSHKGNYGHALLLAGSAGKFGAALLASKACLKTGVGLLTLHSSAAIEGALNSYVPSAMFSADEHQEYISELPDLANYNVIAAGCGMGKSERTAKVIKLLIQQCNTALVLDADAINILSENKTWLSFLPPETILTPHPKEFERLCGKWRNSFERIQMQKDFSVKYNCYVVFKGANTCISTPGGNCYFNSTGNPGMAKGGSGDVLTGIIAALLAQNVNKSMACVGAVYLHGLAGDVAMKNYGQIGMLAEDLINCISEALDIMSQQ
ncbi:MAG: NAD(P)H-hydrate dehydratase [Bacteroidia bacterium]|nr:NAD(P)H-hydrate dehydratase [Bacteroidia bacterium]MCZ2248869.1 NAD(P)H-hydrate dehydratase [Bacteroidia bacterium]